MPPENAARSRQTRDTVKGMNFWERPRSNPEYDGQAICGVAVHDISQRLIQNHNSWVDSIQSVHIIGIAVVLGSVFMIYLRILDGRGWTRHCGKPPAGSDPG
jgi:hypothetical protein